MEARAQKNIAMDFVFRHPFAAYMREKFDGAALVDRDARIIFAIVGDGGLAREIFTTSAETNIFVCKRGGELVQNRVECHIFDGGAGIKGSLADGYHRCKNKYSNCRDISAYLPLPEYPTLDEFHAERIGSDGFYAAALDVLKLDCADVVRFVAVCTDDEAQNAAIARELSRRACGRLCPPAATVFVYGDADGEFVRLRDDGTGKNFGERAARLRNVMYELERASDKEKARIAERATAAFESKSEFERNLNVYACLALRAKLLMCGFDLAEKGERRRAVSEREYLRAFGGAGVPFDPSKPFDIGLRRNVMAVQEHFRWNARMLVCGFVPADRDAILRETAVRGGKRAHTNGKSFELRRHGNLTTFGGLKEFSRLIAERDGVSLSAADVIKYDFEIMDGAHRIADACGYDIIQAN